MENKLKSISFCYLYSSGHRQQGINLYLFAHPYAYAHHDRLLI